MIKKVYICFAVALFMSGCASLPLEPQASRVIVTHNPAPKDCKFAGQVIGNQGNLFTGVWTSNKNLEEGALNDLRNQASKLNANYVQLVNTRAGTGFDMRQTNVINVGNAYSCPASSNK